MTDDELIYAADETFAQLQQYADALEARHKGKIARAYSGKLFRIERAEIRNYHGIWLRGSMLRKDGTPHARQEYGMPASDIEFVESDQAAAAA